MTIYIRRSTGRYWTNAHFYRKVSTATISLPLSAALNSRWFARKRRKKFFNNIIQQSIQRSIIKRNLNILICSHRCNGSRSQVSTATRYEKWFATLSQDKYSISNPTVKDCLCLSVVNFQFYSSKSILTTFYQYGNKLCEERIVKWLPPYYLILCHLFFAPRSYFIMML